MEQINALAQSFPGLNTRAEEKSTNELGQEQFLKLLIAQLENQDPSKPVENGEFLTQIAQFSMVSGIGGLEKGFESLSATLQGNQVAEAAALLGRNVLFDGNTVNLQPGATAAGQLTLQQSTNNVQVRVIDAKGATISNVSLGARNPTDNQFVWDGKTMDGSAAPAGQYRLAASGTVNGVEQALPVRLYGQVESVLVDPVTRNLALQLTDGASLSLADIHEFR